MPTILSMDFETKSEADLKREGGYRYATDMTTEALLLAYRFDQGPVELLDFTDGDTLPPEVRDALLDPHVEKWAFNAAFERLITRHVLGIETPYKGWRCTMALAYMRSFTGGLEQVGVQLGMSASQLKNPEGTRLVRKFTMPQRLTKANTQVWHDSRTHPEDWQQFRGYCVQDVVAEDGIKEKLLPLPTLESEWRLYEIDQEINDRGLPVDMEFVRHAAEMATRRKAELIAEMADITGLKNPNSPSQLLGWLKLGGYPFDDLGKLTVKKVLTENEVSGGVDLPDIVVQVLKLRQQSARTSVKKYNAVIARVDEQMRLRHCFQFAGAQRTNRWSGRSVQPQNLVRTPKELEREKGDKLPVKLFAMTDAIKAGDYDMVRLLTKEPMEMLAGTVRSAFRAPEGYEFVVCDLSAIESAVIAWLAECGRMIQVFVDGRDPYKDFAIELYKVLYEEVTSFQRGIAKPAVLGCGFGLGGGKLIEGKKTGLWGYAENMGVNIERDEAWRQVALFRSIYAEIPEMWKSLEGGVARAMRGEIVDYKNKLQFRKRGDYMTMQLPSGRVMFYHRPRMDKVVIPGKPKVLPDGTVMPGEPWEALKFTCMGTSQVTKKWQRIQSGGPKTTENAVQATAREVLANGMRLAHKAGFNIVGHIHDELISLQRKGDNYFTLEKLMGCMTHREFWMGDLPLKAAGYVSELYLKD